MRRFSGRLIVAAMAITGGYFVASAFGLKAPRGVGGASKQAAPGSGAQATALASAETDGNAKIAEAFGALIGEVETILKKTLTDSEGKPTGNVETGITFQTEDIDAAHADLKAKGVDVDDEVSRMGGPVPPLLWFRDPEGNVLMVVDIS